MSSRYQHLNGKKEIVKHTFLCASRKMGLTANLIGVDFIRKHLININSTNAFIQVSKNNNLLYQDLTLQDSAHHNSAFLLPPDSIANQISGSLDIPSALWELKESKIDTFQDIDIFRATHYDFFQHEEDLSIIPTGDTISKDTVPTLEHLPATAAAKLTDVLNNYKPICFDGFEVEADISPRPGAHCRQPPRNKILPQNCVESINNYVDAGLFINGGDGADEFCANITLVKRSSAPGSLKQT